MFRKNYIGVLLDHPMTINQLARQFGEKPNDVANDLEHLWKTLKHGDYEPVIDPATCRKCNYEFDAAKLKKPSKCPECHSTWLEEPRISLRSKSSSAPEELP